MAQEHNDVRTKQDRVLRQVTAQRSNRTKGAPTRMVNTPPTQEGHVEKRMLLA